MKKKSFEQNMSRITEIAARLNTGEQTLAESVKLYKEAVETIKTMHNELETAEGRIVIMRKNSDGVYFEEEAAKDEL